MRIVARLLIVLALSGYAMLEPGAGQTSAETPPLLRMALAPAPEFPAGLQWLNTERPLSLEALRGKVVLLDFWTYGCINCLHILPDVQRLETSYADELVVIGVHSAKYDNEAVSAHIQQAIQRYGITHAVVNDRDYRIWKAYRVPGWPTQVLIDPEGRQIQGFVGENHYEHLDRLIAATIEVHRRKGTLRSGRVAAPPAAPTSLPTPLRYPGKVLADAESARLFIADTSHHRIVVTDMQGHLLLHIGSGAPGFHDGAFATAAFRSPQGMALYGHMLYVADTGNHLIRRVDLRQQRVETWVGTAAKARDFNVPGTGRAVALNSPWALYVQEPYLYVAMAGMHQLWRVHLASAYAEPFVGSGQEDLIDASRTEAALGQPSGLTGDGQHLYVADSEVNAVRAADMAPDGKLATLVGGGLFTFGDQDGHGEAARLQHPLGVAYADGVVYIADTYNHKIKQLDLRSGNLQTLAGSGTAGLRDGPALQAQFYEPGGVSVAAGHLYVADTNSHRIRRIDLATLSVSTLQLRGLTPPAASGATDDLGDVVRLAEQVLPAEAPAAIHIALRLPHGWKINAAAPATLRIVSVGESLRVPAAYTHRTVRPLTPDLRIPVEVAAAGTQGQVRVDLTFIVCEAIEQRVCALREVAWEVPVRSREQADAAEVFLQYVVPSL